MRSNDAWLGFPYDVFTFTTIQKILANCLGLRAGRYVHLVGSFHIYVSDLPKLDRYQTVEHPPEVAFTWPEQPSTWEECATSLQALAFFEERLTGYDTLNKVPNAWQPAFAEFSRHRAWRNAHAV